MSDEQTQPGPSIVITGAGLVTCQGLSAEETWKGVLTRRRAMGPMPALESPLPPGRTGGQAPDLPQSFFPDAPRESRYLRWALLSTLGDPRGAVPSFPYAPRRIGIILGTTLHGIRQGGVYLRTGNAEGLERFLGAGVIKGALRGLPIQGPAFTTCSACSSGLGSIALGMTLLETGQLDMVIAGGYDPVSEYVYAGFDSLRLVAERDTRPFCKGRDGMKVAEGYALVAIEREADAKARHARPLARILGYGESSDSHHLTQPHPEGEGAVRAARAALTSANLPPEAIGLASAHATATPNNDAAEYAAMSRLFGQRISRLPVVAFKSHVGHTLGGAGATELILSMLALRDQAFPPTANAAAEDLDFPVRLNLGEPTPIDIVATMNMSLGFGGANAAMILGRPQPVPPTSPTSTPRSTNVSLGEVGATEAPLPTLRPVLITGLGIVAPNCVGNEAFRRLLASPPADRPHDGHLLDDSIAHLLNARRVRRMSEYVKATLAAAAVACQDAAISDIPAFTASASASAILGTCLGSTSFCESYYRPITKDGLAAANPMLFAEGVPNAAAAQLSLMFQVKGSCQTIIGSRTAGLDALYLAALRIASGDWDRAIVSAGEEFHETAVAIYQALGLYAGSPPTSRTPRGFTLSTGAVALVLESESSANERRVKAWATVCPAQSGSARSDDPTTQGQALAELLSKVGSPDAVVTSANGTWLDRVELAAIRGTLPKASSSGADSFLPELASANALAGLVAKLFTASSCAPAARSKSIAALSTDYANTSTALLFKLGDRSLS